MEVFTNENLWVYASVCVCMHACMCKWVPMHGHAHLLDQQVELLHLHLAAEEICTEYLL